MMILLISHHLRIQMRMGLCCSHAAYCHFYMFAGLSVVGEWWGLGEGGVRRDLEFLMNKIPHLPLSLKLFF